MKSRLGILTRSRSRSRLPSRLYHWTTHRDHYVIAC